MRFQVGRGVRWFLFLIVRSFEPVHELPEGRDVQELFTEKDQDLGFKPNGLPFTNWRDTFIYLDRFIKICR